MLGEVGYLQRWGRGWSSSMAWSLREKCFGENGRERESEQRGAGEMESSG
jgi:hypothetical protein